MTISRNFALGLAAALLLVIDPAGAAVPARPNILFILSGTPFWKGRRLRLSSGRQPIDL